jgi:pimeloyl-ACP methyl ester carboxylesterase
VTSKPEQRNKVLLFIHGIRNDDPDADWRRTLDAALLREGTEPLDARGYRVVAPSYLAELDGEPVPDIDEPPTTYRKSSDEEYDRAAGRYWAALADLERTGIRGRIQPGLGADLPAGAVVEALMPKLFADAAGYCANADRRNAIFARLLAEIPPNADLVIVAHSLGSVVAADLLYRLPEHTELRMLITLGSPLTLDPLRKHLARRRQRFPYEVVGPWINLCGTGDLVTGFRGLSPVFAEALDVVIDTAPASGRSPPTPRPPTSTGLRPRAPSNGWTAGTRPKVPIAASRTHSSPICCSTRASFPWSQELNTPSGSSRRCNRATSGHGSVRRARSSWWSWPQRSATPGTAIRS